MMAIKRFGAAMGLLVAGFALVACDQETQTPAAQPPAAAPQATTTATAEATAEGDEALGNPPPAPAPSAKPQPPAKPKIEYFKVTREPKCEVVGTGTTPDKPGVDIQLSWKVTGADNVAFSDDEPNYYESHGGRAGKRGVFPTTHTMTMEFFCNDGEPTTHEYTINTMGNGASQKKSISFTVPASS